MQVDAPPEDNDNNEEEPYIVENPSLVSSNTSVTVPLAKVHFRHIVLMKYVISVDNFTYVFICILFP